MKFVRNLELSQPENSLETSGCDSISKEEFLIVQRKTVLRKVIYHWDPKELAGKINHPIDRDHRLGILECRFDPKIDLVWCTNWHGVGLVIISQPNLYDLAVEWSQRGGLLETFGPPRLVREES